MSGDINKTILLGRLTRDAELSYTNSGMAISKFSIAVNRRIKKGEEWIDEANFFDCTLWGKRGEALQNYLKRGQQIGIEGELRQERWEKDGVKRSKVTINVTELQLVGKNNTESNQSDYSPKTDPNYTHNSVTDPSAGFEDDIPF